MAKHDSGSNPFGWLILGFICGVVATIGALIMFSGGLDETGEEPVVSSADSAFGSSEEAPAAPGRAPSRTDEEPPAAAPAPAALPPRAAPPQIDDPQIAEDAAASGMTSRSPRQ